MEFLSPDILGSLEQRILFQPDLLNSLKDLDKDRRNLNLIMQGPVGCGQGLAAKELAYYTTDKQIIKLHPSQFAFSSPGDCIQSLSTFIKAASGGILYIYDFDELYTNPHTLAILNYINVESKIPGTTFLLAGEKIAFDKLKAYNPDLFTKFNLTTLSPFSNEQMVNLFFHELNIHGIEHKLKFQEVDRIIDNIRVNGNLRNGRITRLLLDAVIRDMLLKGYSYLSKVSLTAAAQPLLRSDGAGGYAELDELIGLKDVKILVKLWMKNLAIVERRAQLGLSAEGMGQHMVFKGPAGTAKTTVARIVAKILAQTGVITSGHLVEVSKTDLVGDQSEETTRKVTQAVKRAIGGVLFIDEAYALSAEPGVRDSGKEAIETLLKLMEDYRNEFVVIVAGYPLEMEQFLSSNPGLRSRFSKVLEFPSYEVDELFEILNFLANQRGFTIDEQAIQALYPELSIAHHYPGFGNGRHVRNILELAIIKQGSRLSNESSDQELRLLITEDFMDEDLKTNRSFS